VAAVTVIAIFMAVEAIGGWLAHSLALIADAGHMLMDVGSLLLSLVALRIGRRPADAMYSYGRERYEVLAAFVNGLVLLALTVWIVTRAIERLFQPEMVDARLMAVIAAAGAAASGLAFLLLHGRSGLNERGALAHIAADLLGSLAALAAAGIILGTGWMVVDPLLSLLVSMLILRSGWRVMRDSAHVLLEGAPPHFDLHQVESELVGKVPGVSGVHHVHAWSMTGARPIVTLHAAIDPGNDWDTTLAAIHERLRQRLSVAHATVQLEHGDCVDHPDDPSCHEAPESHTD
jgi:cobalt-zinc-cadmium efflux system protein